MKKRILYVCNTHEQAVQKFNELVKVSNANTAALRCLRSSLLIEFEDVEYRFISCSSNLPVKIKGLSFDQIIVDEMVSLSEDDSTELKVHERT